MVCTANDLQGWKDFPKGLRVLVLDGDRSSAAEIGEQLEAMDYNGETFWIPLIYFWYVSLPHLLETLAWLISLSLISG